MTSPTNKEIPSNSVQDRPYNSEKFDEFMNSDKTNYVDRKGNNRWALSGISSVIQNWMGSLSTSSGANNIGLGNGGYISVIALASRAYAKLVNVRAGSFDYTGDVGFITQGCDFTTVTK